MRVANALVVDEIRDREDGSVDLIGLREDLYFDAVPVILESLTLFVEFEVEPGDRGQRHQVEFRLIEADTGRQLFSAPIKFTLPPEHPRPVAPVDPTLFELPFERFAPHYLEIVVNGQPGRRLFLNVLPRDVYGNA